MSRIKNYYHDQIVYQYYNRVYQNEDMPLWVLEQYGVTPSSALEQYGVKVEDTPLTIQDMINANESIDNDIEQLDQEYRNLAIGEKMLIDVVFEEDGTAYPQYITKQ